MVGSVSLQSSLYSAYKVPSQADMDAMRQQRLEKIFKEADTDGSGALSKGEFTDLVGKMQSRASQGRAAVSMPSAEDLFKLADADGSGSVSKDELVELFKQLREQVRHGAGQAKMPSTDELFKAADSDGDGKINQEEFTSLMEQMRPQGGPPRGGPDGPGGVGGAPVVSETSSTSETDSTGPMTTLLNNLLAALQNNSDVSSDSGSTGSGSFGMSLQAFFYSQRGSVPASAFGQLTGGGLDITA